MVRWGEQLAFVTALAEREQRSVNGQIVYILLRWRAQQDADDLAAGTDQRSDRR